jgi:hypothetical protein
VEIMERRVRQHGFELFLRLRHGGGVAAYGRPPDQRARRQIGRNDVPRRAGVGGDGAELLLRLLEVADVEVGRRDLVLPVGAQLRIRCGVRNRMRAAAIGEDLVLGRNPAAQAFAVAAPVVRRAFKVTAALWKASAGQLRYS